MLEHWAGDFGDLSRDFTGDAFAERDEILAELRRAIPSGFAGGAGPDVDLRSRTRRIGLARDLESAWVTDEIELRVVVAGDPRVSRLRFSGVAAETDSGWRFVVFQLSRPSGLEADSRLATPDAPWAPREPGAAAPDRRTRTVSRLFERTMSDTGRWLRYVTRRQDVSFVAPDTVVHGARAVRHQLRREFARGLWERDASAGVRLGRAGRVGWAVTTLRRRTTVGGREVAIPQRALFVYHRRGETWGLVHVHLSSALAELEAQRPRRERERAAALSVGER